MVGGGPCERFFCVELQRLFVTFLRQRCPPPPPESSQAHTPGPACFGLGGASHPYSPFFCRIAGGYRGLIVSLPIPSSPSPHSLSKHQRKAVSPSNCFQPHPSLLQPRCCTYASPNIICSSLLRDQAEELRNPIAFRAAVAASLQTYPSILRAPPHPLPPDCKERQQACRTCSARDSKRSMTSASQLCRKPDTCRIVASDISLSA